MASVDVLIASARPDRLPVALESVEAVRAAEPDLDLRVQVVADPEHRGAAWARNRAAEQGDAEFLALLDDDDRWLAPRLGRAVEVLRRRPEIVLVAGDAQLASGPTFLPGRPADGGEGRDHGALALGFTLCTSTVTLRRADWEAAAGMAEDLRRAEDYDLWLRLTRDGRRLHVLPDLLAWHDDLGDGLASDPAAVARDTLTALGRSADMPEGDAIFEGRLDFTEGVRVWRDRRGRLRAVLAHGLAKEGRFGPALDEALRAVREAPAARVAWTSLLRAGLHLRR